MSQTRKTTVSKGRSSQDSGKGSGKDSRSTTAEPQVWRPDAPAATPATAEKPREIGGRDGPEPVRYGDWEKNGRCIDF